MLMFDRNGYNPDFNCYVSRYHARQAIKRLNDVDAFVAKHLVDGEVVYRLCHIVELKGGL